MDECRNKYIQRSQCPLLSAHWLIAPEPAKIEAIVKMSPPTSINELRAFLGTTGYYRRYARHYAQIVRPLHRLLRPGVAYIWGPEQQEAFEMLKTRLSA